MTPDEIDAALFAGDEYLDDAGFSDRVVRGLPRPRRRGRRSAIILGFSVAAAAVGAAVLPLEVLVNDLANLSFSGPMTLAAGVSLLATLGGAAVVGSDV
jgi:hypothetical protein